ncbi:MAG: hypothetical protein DSY90_13475 [Deltaproteobacteria bacterium]|nr:MAG: hypothetical protein DSY90_13475 [Deltaproteobacteria bacterium]
MSRFSWLIICLFCLGGCTGIPRMVPLYPLETILEKPDCRQPFAKNQWQFVHTIRMETGRKASFFSGVITVDPAAESVRCTLLTLEGLVLFDARLTRGKPEVIKAVPPFDRPALATGILTDVGLIFLSPAGPPETGRTGSGDIVCRFGAPQQGIVEVVPARDRSDRSWQIRKYDENGRVVREVVTGTSGRWEGAETLFIPDTFTLTATGSRGYRLHFRCLSSTRIGL